MGRRPIPRLRDGNPQLPSSLRASLNKHNYTMRMRIVQ